MTVLPPVNWADAARQAAFERWFEAIAPRHALDARTLQPASADASFRRYLRVQAGSGSLVIMDAPPPQEDVRPFVHVAGLLQAAGLNAARVLECNAEQGFLLLNDLGQRLYLDALRTADAPEANRLMRDATQALVQFQLQVPADTLPAFDETLLRRELDLFPTWCVQREFGITWTDKQAQTWAQACDKLVASALAQPQVAVHADWMPRNLMVMPAGQPNPGILDFQDAVRGPITYDMASLLRDAFLSWPEEQEIDWAVRQWEAARKAGLPVDSDFGEHWRALEWMGLQRHLKVLGIFCRLKHRDGKPAYAEDLPRFFAYATKTAMRYRELAPLVPLLEALRPGLTAVGVTMR